MTDIGDLSRFGFRIGPPMEASISRDVRDVSIFINGADVSRHDRSAYLPSYVGSLQAELDCLKRRLNFEKYADRFLRYNITQIHNMLLHGDPNVFADESDWQRVAGFHRFMALNEPNTDCLAAFLIPSDNGLLYLTYQYESDRTTGFHMLDIIDGVSDLLPFDLIQVIDAAIARLKSGT